MSNIAQELVQQFTRFEQAVKSCNYAFTLKGELENQPLAMTINGEEVSEILLPEVMHLQLKYWQYGKVVERSLEMDDDGFFIYRRIEPGRDLPSS